MTPATQFDVTGVILLLPNPFKRKGICPIIFYRISSFIFMLLNPMLTRIALIRFNEALHLIVSYPPPRFLINLPS